MEILKERYSITELSEILGISDHALRFYEKEFELHIPKDERGRRYYTADMANLMYKIKLMRSEGLEIKAIKKILQEDCLIQPPQPLAPSIIAQETTSLTSPANPEYAAIREFFNEFAENIVKEISTELSISNDHLTREILKTKLELGACVENGMRKLEGKLDRHFEEVDKALSRWREKNKRNTLTKIFPLFIKKR